MKESRDQTIARLLSLMRKKKEYMETLKILALKQKAALDSPEDMDAEAVLGILEERRSIINKVDMLDAEVYGTKGAGAAGGFEGAKRKDFPSEALELEKEIARIAREIYDADRESAAAAEEVMKKLKEKIKEVNLHRKSKDFYKGKGKGFSGVFLNEKR